MKAAVLLCTLLVAPAGCRASPPPASDAGDVPDPFLARAPEASAGPGTAPEAGPAGAPRSTQATLRLLDPGQPPRKALSYAWRRERGETLTIDLRTAAATESEGERPPEVTLPPVRIVLALEPRGVSAGGDLTYAWHVTSTRVTPVAGDDPQLASGMQAEVAAIARLAGTATVSSHGLARDVSVDPATGDASPDSGATGQMVEQVRQTLSDLVVPFPDEPVGRGARWEKLARLASRSVVVTQTETFTLASVAGDRGGVDDVLAQTAPAQDWRGSGGGADPGRLESMLATGTAKARFDRTRIVPESTFNGTTTMVLSGRHGGDAARRVTMILRVGITLSGALE